MSEACGRIEIPPNRGFVSPALSFIERYAQMLGMEDLRTEHLLKASAQAIEMVVHNNPVPNDADKVAIDVFEKEGSFHVQVLNRGVPLFVGGTPLREASAGIDKVSIENLGRKGQLVLLSVGLGEQALRQSMGNRQMGSPPIEEESGLLIRKAEPSDATSLSQLFYRVYGYNYIHEFIYYPEKIQEMYEQGKLVSTVGVLPNGRLVGHVGLMKWADQPAVFEPCLGVVDPGLQSRGLFGKIFAKMMEQANQISMQYLFFDFVTNHDLSQRLVAKYNPCELSLFVGCQSKATQARLERLGIGTDSPDMDRYSLLYAIIPGVSHAFGKHILLPESLGESLGFLLHPLGLSWSPASRFDMLPAEGEFKMQYQSAQSAVIFDLYDPGRMAVKSILKEWSELLRDGYKYAAIDLPVKTIGLGNCYDLISKSGFFISGFIPYRHSSELGIRFQAIGPTKVAWDDIKLHSPTAKKLLSIIRKNYERNSPV